MSNSKELKENYNECCFGTVNPECNPIFVDYLTMAINEIEDHTVQFQWLNSWFNKAGLTISTRRTKAPIGYDIAYLICVTKNQNVICGSIKYSERHHRILIQFTGNGCAMFEKYDDYSWLISFTNQKNIEFKRVDLAHDDYKGTCSIEAVDKAYCRGRFNSKTGKRPKKTNWGNPSEGRTRYIGGNTTYKSICIYEKGKKEGAINYLGWVRFEVRFKSNGRDNIPKDILKNRHQYFYSAYPKVLKRFVNTAEYCSVVYRKNLEYACSIGHSFKHSRKQYGVINNEAYKILGDDIARDILTREGNSKSTDKLPFVTYEYLNLVFGDLIKCIAKSNGNK